MIVQSLRRARTSSNRRGQIWPCHHGRPARAQAGPYALISIINSAIGEHTGDIKMPKPWCSRVRARAYTSTS